MKTVTTKVPKVIGIKISLRELLEDYMDGIDFYFDDDNSWTLDATDDLMEVKGPKKGLTIDNVKIKLTNGPASSES